MVVPAVFPLFFQSMGCPSIPPEKLLRAMLSTAAGPQIQPNRDETGKAEVPGNFYVFQPDSENHRVASR
jgi:hypothetical protein